MINLSAVVWCQEKLCAKKLYIVIIINFVVVENICPYNTTSPNFYKTAQNHRGQHNSCS